MEAIVHVFETWTKKFPGDVILEKWVNDTLEAVRGLILAAGKALPVLVSDSSSTEKKPVKVNHTQIPEKRKPKVQKLDTHILSTFDDDRYISAGEDEDSRKGGAKMHPLLRKVSKPCHLSSDPTGEKLVRCIAFASHGCNITWSWPRARQRIMKHAPPTMTTSSLTDGHQGRCSDSDDEDGDWLDNGDIANHVGLTGVKSTEFDVGKDINISSTYLLDILSDHALQPTAACGGLSTPKVMAATTSSSTPMDDDEWEEW
ncbi:hypothetical protein DFJ58DRAFT_869265 [Suillus subalutaceus]|uniref:uncharacterized protein n=1 Tax=Suillus subalutaceus TaxID=48586 RepID=UPI001B86D8C8|nr:uncharacterized protein DFJ58DRAFT_869265 [Suillus subalutaceus]KAG1863223.1 hypothetical protein DFJ58DRAFT_869265 [Suillus subalutaceus]